MGSATRIQLKLLWALRGRQTVREREAMNDGLCGYVFIFRNDVKFFRLIWRRSGELRYGHLWNMENEIVDE